MKRLDIHNISALIWKTKVSTFAGEILCRVFLCFVLFIITGLTFELKAGGVNTQWTGSTSSDWTIGGNWSNGVPNTNAASIITIPSAPVNQPSIGSNNITIGLLVMETGASIAGTGTLSLDGATLTVNSNANSSATINCNITILQNQTFSIANNATANPDLVINGILGQSGTRNINKTGAGTLRLSGANTYGGTTTVTAGTLENGADNVISDNTLNVLDGAVYHANGFDETIADLSVDGGTTGGSVTTGAGTLTLGGDVSSSGGTNATISGKLDLGGATRSIDVGTGDQLTISAIISGSDGITKTSTGLLILSGANTYDGVTAVNSGTVKLGVSSSSGTSGPLGSNVGGTTVTSGETLDLNGFSLTGSATEPLSIDGNGQSTVGAFTNSGGNASFAGAITLTAASTIEANASGTLTITGNISGNFALTLRGDGEGEISGIRSGTSTIVKNDAASTWTLSGNNSYSGVTTITAGALKLGIAGNGTDGPLGTIGTNTTIAAAGILDLNGITLSTDEPVSITGTGAIITNTGASAVFSGPISGNSLLTIGGTGDIELSGIRSGTNGITKEDANTLILSAPNTYSNTTTINGGVVKLGASSSTNASGPLGTSGGGVTVASGAALDLNGFSLTGTATDALSLTGTGVGGLGALTNSSALPSSYIGVITFAAGSSVVGETGTIDITGTPVSSALGFIIGGTAGGTFSTVIAGARTLTKEGTGTWTLSGTNTYSLATSVSAGTLKLNNTAALGTSSATTVSTGAVLDLNGITLSTARPLTLNGTGLTASPAGALTNTGGNASYAGNIILGAASTITATSSGTLTCSGTVGTGAFALTLDGASSSAGTMSGIMSTPTAIIKNGAGSWTLSGVNTYSGTTTINGGTLAAGVATQAFGLTSAVTLANTSGAVLDITGFNNTIGSLTGGGASGGNITLGSATLTIGSDNTSPAAYAGVISGSGIVGKSGSGTLILTGTNTYTGATNVTAGILNIQNVQGTGTTAGGVTVSSGASLQVQGNIAVGAEALQLDNTGGGNGALRNISGANTWGGTITLVNNAVRINSDAGSLTLNASNSITATNINLTIGGATNTTVSGTITTGTGTFTKDGAGTVTLTGANTYSGAVTISAGILSVDAVANAASSSPLGNGNTTPAISIGGSGTLQYTGSGGHSTSRAITLTGTGATLDASGSGAVTFSSAISGATFGLVLTGTGSGTSSGIIGTTTGTLTKNGAGTWTVTGTNTYSGAVTINAGILSVDAVTNAAVSSPLGNGNTTPAISIAGSGTLQYTGSGGHSTSRAITLTGTGATLDASGSGAVTFSSAISGATFGLVLTGTGSGTSSGIIGTTTGTLTKNGAGTWAVTGTNTYSGAVTINAGILSVNAVTNAASSSPLGNGNTTPAISIGGSGTLQYTGSGGHSTSRAITLTGTGATLDASGSGAVTFSSAISGATFGLVLTGTGSGTSSGIIGTTTGTLTKNGAGTWILSGTNTYTGATSVTVGILNIQNVQGTGTTAGGVTVSSGASLQVQGNIAVGAEALQLDNTGGGNGALRNISGANTWGGTITLVNNAVRINSDAGSLTLNASNSITATNINLTIGGATNTTVSGTITTGTGTFTKDGAGTVTLTGANTYSGAVTINAGILSVNAVTNAASSSPLGNGNTTPAISIAGSGTLQYTGSGGHSTSRAITLTGTGATLDASGSGAVTFSSAISGATFGLVLTGTGSGTSSGIIGTTTGTLTKNGAGTWTVTGTNTYSGAVTISAGILSVDAVTNAAVSSPLGNGNTTPAISIAGSGTLQYTGSGGHSTSRAITLTGTGATLDASGSGAVTFSSAISGATFGLVLTGTGSGTSSGIIGTTTGTLTKNGAGTWTVTGTNTYSGAVTINAGILSVNVVANAATNSPLGTGSTTPAISIGGSGTLQYTGTGGHSTSRAITLTGTGATLDASGSGGVTFSSAISGATFGLVLTGTGTGTSSGVIGTTTGTLTKNGAGTWTVTGTNTYSGAVTINAGILSVNVVANAATNSPLGTGSTTPAISIGGSGTLQYTGSGHSSSRAITLTGTGATLDASGSGGVTFSSAIGGATFGLVLTGTGTGTSSGVIGTTTGTLTKNGAGTWTVTGTNTYSGAVTINAGILSVNVVANAATNSPLGTGSTTPAISIGGSGTLQYTGTGGHSTSRAITLTGTGATLDASGSGGVTFSSAIGGATFGLVLTGTGSGTSSGIIGTTTGTLTKNGAGTWILSGTNTYTGATSVTVGILNIQNAQGTGTTAGGVTVSSGASLQVQGNIAVGAEALQLDNTGGGNGALRNISGANTWGGTITLVNNAVRINSDAGSLTLNASNSITATNINIAIGGATNTTVSGTITTGTGTFTKDGAGTVTLTGANTYSGAVTISAGILSVDAVANAASSSPLGNGNTTPAISIAGSGTLQYTGTGGHSTSRAITLTGTGATLDASGSGGVTFSSAIGGATFGLVLTGTGTGTSSGIIGTTTGTLTKNGAGTWAVTGTNTYSGAVTISAGILSVDAVANAASSSPLGNGNTTPAISIAGSGTLQYTGSGGHSTSRAITLTGTGATLDASGSGAVTFSSAISGATFGLVLTGTGSGTSSGIIGTTTGTLTKNGAGTWTVTGTNTYSGAVTINAGILSVDAVTNAAVSSPLGNGNTTPAISIAGSGTLQYTGSGGHSTSRAITLTGTGATLDASGSGAVTFSSAISGATFGLVLTGTGSGTSSGIIGTTTGTLTKNGAGTWAVTGTNTYSGAVTINAGILSVNAVTNAASSSPLGNGNTTPAISIGGSGTLQYTGSGGHSTSRAITLTGTGATLDASGSGAVTFSSAISGATFGLVLTGTGSGTSSGIIGTTTGTLTKNGAGTWILSGTNTYTGATSVTVGILNIQNVQGTGTTAGGVTVSSGASLQVQGNIAVGAEALQLDNTGGGNGALRNISGANTWGGTITLVNNAVRINSDAGSLTLNASNSITATNINLTIGGATNTTVSGTITTGTGTFTKDGAGTVTLTGANTYSGAVTINAGILSVNAVTNAASSSPLGNGNTTPAISIAGSGTLQYTGSGGHSTSRAITLTGTGATLDASGSGAVTFSSAISGATFGLVLTGTGSGTSSGIIGTTTGTLTKNGAGTWTVTGTNTYSGAVTISAGILSVDAVTNAAVSSPLGNGNTTPAISIAGSGTLQYTGSGGHSTSRAITLTGTGATLDASGSGAVTFSSAISGATFGLVLTGTGSGTSSGIIGTTTGTLTKNGAGTWTVTGTNTYSGAVTINAGILSVNVVANAATNSPLGTGSTTPAISIGGSGTLQYTGTGGHSTSRAITLTGTGATLDASGSGGVTFSSAISGATFGLVLTGTGTGTSSGVIGTTTGTLTKNGAGTWTVTGTNTYSGAVTINAGILSVNVVANAATNSPLGTGSTTPAISIGGSGTLQYTGSGHSSSRAITLTGTGATLDASGGGALTLSGAIGGATFGLVLTGTGSGTSSGIIGTTTGTLTKNGAGTWTLSGVNTYTGATTVNTGILVGGVATQAFGVNSAVTLANTAGVSIDITGFSNTIGSITGGGVIGGNVTLGAATLTIGSDNTSPATYAGVISGSGGSIIKTGSGALTLSGTNTYTGGSTLSAGTLNINNLAALGASGTFTISGGTIDNTSGADITTNNYTLALNGDFTYSGSIPRSLNLGTGAVTMSASRQITVSAGTLTIGGVINNNAQNITKAGSGTLSFGSQAVTLNNVTISAGTLVSTSNTLGIAGSLTNSGTFTHNSGTVDYNAAGAQSVTVVPYQSLSCSNSGTKTAAGDLVVNGTLTVGGSVILDMTSAFTLTGTLGTIANSGTIRTSVPTATSSAPLATGKTWNGTVNYAATTGLQTVVQGTYTNVTMSNTSAANAMGGSLTIGGLLTMSGGKLALGSNTLTLNGTTSGMTSSSSLTSNASSSISIGGSGALGTSLFMDQTTPGTTNRLVNLTYNRTSATGGNAITLGNALQVTGTVTPTTGEVASGGNLTLISNASGTANIANGGCTSCSYLTGNVNIQRFVSSVARRFRFMGSTVQSTTLDDWQDEIYITGSGAGFDPTASSAPSVYWYDETMITGNLNTGWTAATATTNAITVGKGYRVFIRGDRSDIGRLTGTVNDQNAVTMDLVGVPNQGNISIPMTLTYSGVGATYDANNDGWNMVSNPFACGYDWNAHYDDSTTHANIQPVIWMLSGPGGGYVSYNAFANAGSLTTGIIPAGGSFWVKANNTGTPTLTFKEQYKSLTAPLAVYKTNAGENFSMRLYYDSITYDDAMVKYITGSTENYDDYDIRKLAGTVTLSIYGNDNVHLDLSSRPPTLANDTIKLYVSGAVGAYQLKFNNSSEFAVAEYVYLFDTYLATVTDLKTTNNYPFSILSGVAASSGLNRFYIVISNNASLPVKLLQFSARKTNKKQVQLNWSTAQEINSKQFEIERSTDGTHYITIATVKAAGNTNKLINYAVLDEKPMRSNYYRLKEVDLDGALSYSSVQYILLEEIEGAKLYPVPARTTLTIEHDAAITSVTVFNVSGSIVGTYLGTGLKTTIDVEKIKTGVYIIEYTDELGNIARQKFTKE